MEKKIYNKLVRDRIPETIQAEGRELATEILSEDDFGRALRTKLVEESQEVSEAEGDNLIKELADVFEVIDSLLEHYQLDRSVIIDRQEQHRLSRGGFRDHIMLLWTK